MRLTITCLQRVQALTVHPVLPATCEIGVFAPGAPMTSGNRRRGGAPAHHLLLVRGDNVRIRCS